MDKKIIEEFNLPGYIKGKSFSDASKAISRKFKDREDPHSKMTEKDLLKRLAEAQEYVKQMEASEQQEAQEGSPQSMDQMQRAMDNNAQEVPDQMGGQVPKGMEQFIQGQQGPQPQEKRPMPQQGQMRPQQGNNSFDGGGFLDPNIKKLMPELSRNADTLSSKMSSPSGAGAAGAGKMASTALDLGKTAFGDTGVDTSGNSGYVEKPDSTMDTIGGAAKGASAGMALGPIGAGAGAVIGGAAGLFGSNRKKKEAKEANQKRDLSVNSNIAPNTFAGGGLLELINSQRNVPTPDEFENPDTSLMSNLGSKNPRNIGPKREPVESVGSIESRGKTGDNLRKRASSEVPPKEEKFNDSPKLGKMAKDFIDKHGTDLARLSPVAYNLIKGSSLDDPERVRRGRLETTYTPDYADTNQMTNMVDENNVNRALSESSGGDLGGLRSSIIAANLNKDKAKSQAYQQAEQVNRGENTRKQRMDAQTDRTNLMQGNRDLVDNQQSKGARETAKSGLIGQGMTQIGQIGKELQDREIAAEAMGYTHDGNYVNDSSGEAIDIGELDIKQKGDKFYDKDGKEVTKEEIIELNKKKQ